MYAPSTFAERSFSVYKSILAPNRRSFKFEKIKMQIKIESKSYRLLNAIHIFKVNHFIVYKPIAQWIVYRL